MTEASVGCDGSLIERVSDEPGHHISPAHPSCPQASQNTAARQAAKKEQRQTHSSLSPLSLSIPALSLSLSSFSSLSIPFCPPCLPSFSLSLSLSLLRLLSLSLSLSLCVYLCVCVCVCVRARARARARVCVCVCVCTTCWEGCWFGLFV